MPCVRRARVAALAAAMSVTVGFAGTGCGAGGAPGDPAEPRLFAAVLTQQDMPPDYLPAENTKVFRGLRPTVPRCRELLALADLRGLHGVPHADAAYYQVAPGGEMVEHLLAVPPVRAHAYIAGVRETVRGCAGMTVRNGGSTIGLRRVRLPVGRTGAESYGVRYAGWIAGHRYRFHVDLFTAREAGRLLVIAHLALLPRVRPPELTARIVERAAARLRRPAPPSTPIG